MSTAKFTDVPNGLASIGLGRRGKSAADAIKGAEANLEAIRPRLLLELDARLGELDRQYGRSAGARRDGDLQGLYDCALSVIEVAGALPDSGVNEAAKALCELASGVEKATDWGAVDVHLDAIKMLRAADQSLSAVERLFILKGLAEVCLKVQGGGAAD